ncbi:ABC transporter substrate-binding protein, partial [Tabrizicola sp.]|uniref:ABC transporter substrate-binding protein n=1 Tax=Tabrizicola sp. TaxID=2005166 RepID=UPI003F35CAD7
MPNDPILSRRAFGAGLAAGLTVLSLPRAAMAFTVEEARALIDKAVADVTRIINSGKSQNAMYPEFEKVFARYGDVPTIARSALGPAARSASNSQLRGFTKAYQGYIARKYGRRFREFI